MTTSSENARELPQYSDGLLEIMETRKVNLDEALKIALEDIEKTQGTEHTTFINEAYRFLKDKSVKT